MRKTEILKLWKQGKTYKEICKILNCSKGCVYYHVYPQNREKHLKNSIIKRKKLGWLHQFYQKIATWKLTKTINIPLANSKDWKRAIKGKILNFIYWHRSVNTKGTSKMTKEVNRKTVMEKIGKNPTCYLTGEPIDLTKSSTYSLDHIIPRSRGGKNTLDNMGLVKKEINLAKSDKTPEEFIELCKKVLKHQGYKIINP